MKNNRKTIGFLIDFFCEGYQAEILNGVLAEIKAHDLNLLCFTGGELNNPQRHHECRNDIYSLVNREQIDGLIILGGTIGNFVETAGLQSFFQKFEPLPIVNIGTDIDMDNIPSILIDNTSGMREAIEHLINEHGSRKLAFIRGTEENKEAQLRYNVYKEVLKEYGIPFNPDLVTPGDFYIGSGKRAVSLLMDERQVSFDALIGSNDIMALEALKELQERNIRIPYDIAVIGFDNIEESSFNKPPLTTVSQPFFQMGRLAVKTLLNSLKGKKVDKTIYLNTHLEVRRSCGCILYKKRRYISLFQNTARDSQPLSALLKQEQIHYELVKNTAAAITFLNRERDVETCAEELVSSLIYDVDYPGEFRFLSSFDKIISQMNNIESEFTSWDYVISSIMEYLVPRLSLPADLEFLNDLANDTIDIIRENERVKQFTFIQKSSDKSRKLHLISIELINTFSITRLKKVISRELPGLGMRKCFIAEYLEDQSPAKRVRMLVAYDETGEIGIRPGQREFNARDLLPEYMQSAEDSWQFIIMALYFKDEPLGYALFDFTSLEGIVYERLAIQISGTLKGAKLIEKVQQHAEELENKNVTLEKQQVRLSHHLQQLNEAMTGFVNTLIATVEVRDPYTAGHLRKVARLACTMAREMGVGQEVIQNIHMAASIHDLGKIYVPSEILNRPGDLSELEMDMIRTHPYVAYNILRNIDFPWPIAEIIYQHHEHFNGKGYPRGLQGNEILLEARIICVADVVEAIASHRPYRSSLGITKALDEIEKNAGILYDPEAVAVCLMIFRDKGYQLE